MAVLQLPTFKDRDAYRYEVELSGALFWIELRWNRADGRWYLSIADATEAPLLTGLRVVSDAPLLRLGADARLPPGDLVAYSATPGKDPGKEDLTLVYVEPEEVADG